MLGDKAILPARRAQGLEGLLDFLQDNPRNIRILYGDFFKSDLSQATHVFVYLLPQVMDELLSKFIKELKKGTIVVSYNFAFSQKNHLAGTLLGRIKQKKIGRLYVYEF